MDRGVKDGNGGCLGVDHECECIERGVLMGRTHTRRTNTGLVNWGIGALNQGAVQGLGMVWAAGTCRVWGGERRGIRICGRNCGERPTTLTASWWAGYSGREGGGRGEERAESPGGDSVRQGRNSTKKG